MLDITACLICGITHPFDWRIAGRMPPLGLLQSKTLPGSGRKLFDLTHHNVAPIAEEGLNQIADLYGIEAQARGTSAEDQLAQRHSKSAPKITPLKS
jgi:hypothetical protein